MEDTWRTRLAAAIRQSGRSYREVSLKAGLGPGYVHGLLEEHKEPTLGRLLAIADVLGVSVAYLAKGIDVTADQEKLLQLYASLPEPQRRALISLAESMAPEGEDTAS